MRGAPVVHPGHSRRPIKSARKDQRVFSRTASRVHPLNAGTVMRGGVRL